jgi:hypothetical protein
LSLSTRKPTVHTHSYTRSRTHNLSLSLSHAHNVSGLPPAARPSWIPLTLHVDCIGQVPSSLLRLSQRHSCRLFPLLRPPKRVGHQDPTATQPPTWLLLWLTRLPCILGLTQWVLLALRSGGLTRLSWVASSFLLRPCTSTLSTTPSLLRSRRKLQLPSLALVTYSLRQTPSTVMS